MGILTGMMASTGLDEAMYVGAKREAKQRYVKRAARGNERTSTTGYHKR